MNELDKLRLMLDAANIPYENHVQQWKKENIPYDLFLYEYGEVGKYYRNQIIYGRIDENNWKFDGVCHYGSYGAKEGLIETYGWLGVDEEGYPRVMDAEEAFEIISKEEKKNE